MTAEYDSVSGLYAVVSPLSPRREHAEKHPRFLAVCDSEEAAELWASHVRELGREVEVHQLCVHTLAGVRSFIKASE